VRTLLVTAAANAIDVRVTAHDQRRGVVGQGQQRSGGGGVAAPHCEAGAGGSVEARVLDRHQPKRSCKWSCMTTVEPGAAGVTVVVTSTRPARRVTETRTRGSTTTTLHGRARLVSPGDEACAIVGSLGKLWNARSAVGASVAGPFGNGHPARRVTKARISGVLSR
jgi:hypothetical protein